MVNRIPARAFENDGGELGNSLQFALETIWTAQQRFFNVSLRYFELNTATLAAIFVYGHINSTFAKRQGMSSDEMVFSSRLVFPDSRPS